LTNSRDLNDLLPAVRLKAEELLSKAKELGIDLIVTSTYRDKESQDELYAIGRTKPGKRVTNARGGYSFHNYRVAFDVVPLVAGKASWDDMALWQRIGILGEEIGLEWGGNWRGFKDIPHFQLTMGKSLNELQDEQDDPQLRLKLDYTLGAL